MSDGIRITIGICAYNEGGNIEKCIRSIFEQEFDGFVLDKVIVVSSASTDDTEDIVRSLMDEYDKLMLVVQERREGKNSAINRLLEEKDTEIVVMVNADNILARNDTIQKMVEPFLDEGVGIVGGHPIVLNDKNNLPDFASNLIWTLHHHIAMTCPKVGELIAFRDVGTRLPVQNQSDEDLLRVGAENAGLRAHYAPDALTYIRGPETIHDLILQRYRVNIGQSYMISDRDYYNPSRDPKILFKVLSDTMKDLGYHPFKLVTSVMIEVSCRIAASIYVKKGKKDLSAWTPVSTTKKL